MKHHTIKLIFYSLVFGIAFIGFPSTAPASDACSRGLAEPPFLSFGVNSNLLLLLDNSGSMLDMAYIDPDTQCFDKSFLLDETDTLDSSIEYAGNFELLIPVVPPATPTDKAWYKWVEGVNAWEHKIYAAGDLAYENGVIYKAITASGSTSSGEFIYDDPAVEWEHLLRPTWRKSTSYHAGSFVINPDDDHFYFTENGGTSSAVSLAEDINTGVIDWIRIETWQDATNYTSGAYVIRQDVIYKTVAGGLSSGTNPWNDTGVSWIEIDPFAWKSNTDYSEGEIVTYQGMVYRAMAGYSKNTDAKTIYEDNFSTNWSRIDEGYFELITAADATALCDTAAATSGNTKYTTNDLCVTRFQDSSGTKPDKITAFAATGNLLNWLVSSKFDIQKSILTGGKYDKDAERMISENRGCSGSRFIKQVDLDSGEYLTITVRGANNKGDPIFKDRIDSFDDTARIEILSISGTPFDADACQLAVDKILEQGLAGSQNYTDACLAGSSSSSETRDALNHAIQYCWMDNITRNLNPVVQDCEAVYNSISPSNISSFNDAYNCYGIFNQNQIHNIERIGYAGRCWARGVSATGSTCDPYERQISECDWTTGSPCEYQPGGAGTPLFRNRSDFIYTEICTDLKTNNIECRNNNKWTIHYADSITGAICDPNDPAYNATAAGWSGEIDGNPATTPDTFEIPPVNNNTGLSDQAFWCFYKAMEDYCNDLKVPQVIDPSDQATTTTGELGNIPSLLIESGVLNQLGIEQPLLVMKGYTMPPVDPADPTKFIESEGIIHETAQDLRLGAMAFNDVGAFSECQTASDTDRIVEYCPGTNKDGAQIISPVRPGSLLIDNMGTADTSDDIFHVDNLADAINAVRATSWTPLAEAMYNAIGYYTQNPDLRLNNTDFQTDTDVITPGWQQNFTYAPGSFVLDNGTLYQTIRGGITNDPDTDGDGTLRLIDDEGITDWIAIDGTNSIYTFRGTWTDLTTYNAYDIVLSDGKLFYTPTGGTTVLKDNAPATGPRPFYDKGITWEPLIDPVSKWCQDNHILIITEGASTADISSDIANFVAGSHVFNTTPILDPDESTADDPTAQCIDGLQGSTYLDDLTYFGRDPDDLFDVYPTDNATLPGADFPYEPQEKDNITTHIVVAGSLRDNGNATDECNPKVIMRNAAKNGGTSQEVKGENPDELERKLLEIFNELRQRASAGSAASVISSARGGEGAIYQAIFWPQLIRQDSSGTDYTVEWVGDVHGLFLDENGFMYEDTDGDRIMNPTEDIDNDGKLDVGEDKNFDGIISPADGETDYDQDGRIDYSEDLNGNGIFDRLADTDGDGIYDTGIDINGDGIPDVSEDIDGDGIFDAIHEDANQNFTMDGVDRRVIVYFDEDANRSKVCYNISIRFTPGGVCTNSVELDQVKFLWSANEWLSDNTLNTTTNRTPYISDANERFIFTWNDLDNDGMVPYTTEDINDTGELLNLHTAINWETISVDASRGPVINDFDLTSDAEVDMVISWLRGNDWLIDETETGTDDNGNGILDEPQRSRQIPETIGSASNITWRLGDVIHSTPMTVSAPAEGYHFIYNDYSYASFVNRYKHRRHVVYFGGNDGMLHAVNAGFYDPAIKKFWFNYDETTKTYTDNPTTANPNNPPELGAELWAYVPYNLLPHLKCLTNTAYTHKYYVDLRPRIFDVQIFDEETACATSKSDINCKHPNGWGTIVVGGMRFGGAPIDADELNGLDGSPSGEVDDNREFISSYFILDITDPENPPVLLGELTRSDSATVNLGFSTVIPTMVLMRDDTQTPKVSDWYLILGNGPDGPYASKGVSTQYARLSVLPLKWLTPSGKHALQIPDSLPTATSDGAGTFVLSHSSKSFVSDPITVDFDIDPSYEQYKSDAVYFGTIESETVGDDGFLNYPDGSTYWSGGGHLYRLVMEPTGHQIGGGIEPITTPVDWDTTILLDLGSSGINNPHRSGHPIQPISAAPSIGTDGSNFWLYFGTGRFFDPNDKTDLQQQSFYGIKEPMTVAADGTRTLTWDEVNFNTVGTVSGTKGLLKVDEILVAEDTSKFTAALTCRNNNDVPTGAPIAGDYSCMPWTSNADEAFFYRMENYIAGNGTCSGADFSDENFNNNCVDGWYKDYWPYNNREKNVGQATLLGGLVTFTTYQPFHDVCKAEGRAALYAVYYKTGTSWYENIFGRPGINANGNVRNKVDLGRGLATTPNLHVGSGNASGAVGPKAFVQTSTGEIKEIQQDNLPIKNYRTGRTEWFEVICSP